MTINSSGTALRNAAALARRTLLEMAAEQLEARPEELTVQAGVISLIRNPEKKTSYAELMGASHSTAKSRGILP